MEDAHTVHTNVTGDRSSAYFGVFDGHGSSQFALYCSENLHQLIIASKHFSECIDTVIMLVLVVRGGGESGSVCFSLCMYNIVLVAVSSVV